MIGMQGKKGTTRYVTLQCGNCKRSFDKREVDYNRGIQRGQVEFYCNLVCAGKCFGSKPRRTVTMALLPFGYFMNSCAQRKGKAVAIDRAYLAELWKTQNGTCPLTDWKLILPRSHTFGFENGHDMRNASLDRIDNTKGYVKGNVRFVSVAANLGKRSYSDDDFVRMCKAVADNMAPLAQKLKVA